MTRGKIVIILNGRILTSQEYNGDMGYESVNDNGCKVISLLASIDASKSEKEILADFTNKIKAFTFDFYKSHDFVGPESPLVRCVTDANVDYPHFVQMLNFSKGYTDKWFSDYLYVRDFGNNYKANCTVEDTDHQNVCLKTEKVYVFHFGKLRGRFACDTVCNRPLEHPSITLEPESDNNSSDIKPAVRTDETTYEYLNYRCRKCGNYISRKVKKSYNVPIPPMYLQVSSKYHQCKAGIQSDELVIFELVSVSFKNPLGELLDI